MTYLPESADQDVETLLRNDLDEIILAQGAILGILWDKNDLSKTTYTTLFGSFSPESHKKWNVSLWRSDSIDVDEGMHTLVKVGPHSFELTDYETLNQESKQPLSEEDMRNLHSWLNSETLTWDEVQSHGLALLPLPKMSLDPSGTEN